MCAEDGLVVRRIDSGRVGTVVGHLGERAVKQIGKLPLRRGTSACLAR